jgi:transposase
LKGRPAGGSWSRRSSRPATAPIWLTLPRRPARRGRKRRAKTDNADCDLQLRLLLAGELPESWIPPAQILELRTLVRLRKTLIDQRTAWQQRIHAQLFHQGVRGGLRLRTQARQVATRSVAP